MDDDLHEVRKFRSNLAVQDEAKADYYRRRFETEREQGSRDSRSARWSLPLRGRRVWVPLTAAVLTLGVIVGAAALQGGRGTAPAGSDASILEQAAAELAAGDASVTVPNADEWYYYNEARTQMMGYGRVEMEFEQWTRADHRLIAKRNDAGRITTSDVEGQGVGEVVGVFPDMVATYRFYDQVPDDPQAVLEAIYAKLEERRNLYIPGFGCYASCAEIRSSDWYRNGRAFDLIRALLTSTPAPDAVQAKLFRAMAEIPGVEDAGTITDHTGKDALAVQWLPPTEGKQQDGYSMMQRSQILIDPATNRFRGYQVIDLESGEPREAAVIVNSGIVNEPGQTP